MLHVRTEWSHRSCLRHSNQLKQFEGVKKEDDASLELRENGGKENEREMEGKFYYSQNFNLLFSLHFLFKPKNRGEFFLTLSSFPFTFTSFKQISYRKKKWQNQLVRERTIKNNLDRVLPIGSLYSRFGFWRKGCEWWVWWLICADL